MSTKSSPHHYIITDQVPWASTQVPSTTSILIKQPTVAVGVVLPLQAIQGCDAVVYGMTGIQGVASQAPVSENWTLKDTCNVF
jgi:hypothetical protein